MDKQHIAVFFGGESPEHEVSVITGLQVLTYINKEKFEAFPVYVAKNGEWFVGAQLADIAMYRDLSVIPQIAKRVVPHIKADQKGLLIVPSSSSFSFSKKTQVIPVDGIFTAFHGGIGESGGLQGVFETMKLSYTGSGLQGSILSMDKVIMKQLFEENELPMTKYLWFYRNRWQNEREKLLQEIERTLRYPLFIKPANGGSSIGVSKVHTKKELENGIEVAAVFDRKIIVEESFENTREINISVMGNSGSDLQTSVCEEVFSSAELLTYDDKYKGNSKSKGMASTKRQIPADLSKKIVEQVEKIAKRAYETLDCRGLARIDFLVREKTDEIKILEVNTIPGSMSFYLWEASGVKFQDMITRLLQLAKEHYEDSQKNTTSFSSNILENFSPSQKTAK